MPLLPVGFDMGFVDYASLINRPKINGRVLEGDMTFEDLGITGKTIEGESISLDDALKILNEEGN